MNALFVLIFTCGGALAIGRGLDLALWTDWNTGLCTAGSVWLRYGSLWAALVVGIIAARKLARQPLVLRSACRPLPGDARYFVPYSWMRCFYFLLPHP